MEVSEKELMLLNQLVEMDQGEMKGAFWPVSLTLKEAGIEVADPIGFADALATKGLI